LNSQRATTKELLQHRFIRGARKTAYLTELIERYNDYRARTPGRQPAIYQQTIKNWDTAKSMQSEWTFDTIRTSSAMGTFRNMAKDLMPPGMIPDEEEDAVEEASSNDVRSSYTSGAATRGSDPKLLGSNPDASHSTVVIRPLPEEQDIQTLLAASEDTDSTERPSTPPQQEPPPAYTGSMRSARRASYAARNNVTGPGTVMREADLGSGVDTIRPVKKVDTAGSLRLSSEYVGNLREGAGPSSPTSPVKKDSSSRRVASEAMKAGRSLVDDVVLPTCERVSHRLCS
jgi:serine/threonine-protein kinase 24/25/MST4